MTTGYLARDNFKEVRCSNTIEGRMCNHRFFDMDGKIEGRVRIKCTKCGGMTIIDKSPKV